MSPGRSLWRGRVEKAHRVVFLRAVAGNGFRRQTRLRRDCRLSVNAENRLQISRPSARSLLIILFAAALSSPALAQGVHHPFAVGVNEGAASVDGVSGWILAQESGFYRLLTGAIRAVKESGSAAWMLAALSFGYGVFHAAGPGHGKAVIATYMLANERVLRRGLIICLAAALLQGLVAVVLVGTAFLILGTTAKHMTAAANWIEIASYAGVTILGASCSPRRQRPSRPPGGSGHGARGILLLAPSAPLQAAGGRTANRRRAHYFADDGGATHRTSGLRSFSRARIRPRFEAGFSWRQAALTVAAAGSRPCSGAILVLVFASAQDIFLAGCAAVAAMSLGVAITTGALATSAVYAKKAVARYAAAIPGGR